MFNVDLVKGLFKAHSALHKRSLLSSSITIKSQARWIYYYISRKKTIWVSPWVNTVSVCFLCLKMGEVG